MLIPTMNDILTRIEAFLERHEMPPSTFGREATGEPQLIKSMREGRSPSHRVLERIGTFMADYDREHGTEVPASSTDTCPAGIAQPRDTDRAVPGEQVSPEPAPAALPVPPSTAAGAPSPSSEAA